MVTAVRVVAVVVTFDRLPLLQRLVERLGEDVAAGRLAEVLVVDNASSDGTGEWLAGTGPEWLRHKRLERNTGGAGGFHEGVRWAVEETDADLVWLMDDDGLPDADCLERLLGEPHLDFWGPVVVDEERPDRLVFPIRLPGGTKVVHDLADVRAAAGPTGRLDDIVIPFNGVLLTRGLVERIGYPRAEFFIWGDDHEYRLRAERAGARIATVVDAAVRHPAVGSLGTPMMLGRTTYNHTPSDLKHYCMARNNTVNLRDYRGWPHVLLFWLKTVWFYLFTRPQPGRIALSARAAYAGLRGDFAGHERYLATPPRPPVAGPETTAVVVVTYNRADLLETMLVGLAKLDPAPEAVIVVDNASTDRTPDVLAAASVPGLQVVRSEENLGGAGGFHRGVEAAYDQGFDRIWLMDDDVVPAPDCLGVLLDLDEDCLMAVREDSRGRLAEYAALRFDLDRPWAIKPKTASVVSEYADRAAMPPVVLLENVAFEGFMVRRRVVEAIGLPDESFFIFYDDCDYALRARRAGFRILGVRDAVLVRQLDFDQQHDLAGWKGYYMYRNLFAVHLRYGSNTAVRLKPWLIAAGVVAVSPLRGGRAEARNVVRALRDARRMGQQPAARV
jgi:rhamnopyranosyl-N-acetylglucosaminyl-diphospho-decaprenol beta-1,3/1,4-galactofuranosyltransferase